MYIKQRLPDDHAGPYKPIITMTSDIDIGIKCHIVKDNDCYVLISFSGSPLTHWFPEAAEALSRYLMHDLRKKEPVKFKDVVKLFKKWLKQLI